MENWYPKEKFMEKSWNFPETVGSFMLSRIYNVCLVMVVAAMGGHLCFSKKFKFMVKVYF